MFRALPAIAALLALVSARPLLAQGPDDYVTVVDEYRAGDPDTAIRRLARWPERAVEDSIRYWAKRLRREQAVAAVMLHTELGAAILDSLPSRTAVQLRHAVALVDALAERRDERDYAETVRLRWYQFVISVYSRTNVLNEAEAFVNQALLRYPRDAVLYFRRGILLEIRARLSLPAPPRVAILRGRVPDHVTRAGQTLEYAAADYRRALEIDSRMAAARLHLGWLHVQLENGRAREELTAALADARDDRERYLAHLFLGGLAERENRVDEAAEQYELTRQLCPACQTAYIASSRIEAARGRPEQAREFARRLAALQRADDDPWWDYHYPLDEDALAWLRTEAHRR